jgi:hypothetical protein
MEADLPGERVEVGREVERGGDDLPAATGRAVERGDHGVEIGGGATGGDDRGGLGAD